MDVVGFFLVVVGGGLLWCVFSAFFVDFCVFLFWFVFYVEHPEVSLENNRYFFSHSEEGCNESVSAAGKSCFSKCVL